jgi:hypothetical protein
LYKEYQSGRLRGYYDTQILDETTLKVGLADGRFIEDHRLLRYFDGLQSGRWNGSSSGNRAER